MPTEHCNRYITIDRASWCHCKARGAFVKLSEQLGVAKAFKAGKSYHDEKGAAVSPHLIHESLAPWVSS